jgi:hypothetical protein
MSFIFDFGDHKDTGQHTLSDWRLEGHTEATVRFRMRNVPSYIAEDVSRMLAAATIGDTWTAVSLALWVAERREAAIGDPNAVRGQKVLMGQYRRGYARARKITIPISTEELSAMQAQYEKLRCKGYRQRAACEAIAARATKDGKAISASTIERRLGLRKKR